MIVLHFHNDDDEDPITSEYIVLVGYVQSEQEHMDDYGSPGFALDVYDLSSESEWPSGLPTERSLSYRRF